MWVDPPLDTPSADDPFDPNALPISGGVEPSEPEPIVDEEGPSYERDQDPTDTTGGSTDPHNSLSHADGG